MNTVRHPVSGKDVRIMQTDASMWKEHKTLALQHTPSKTVYDTISIDGNTDYLIQLDKTSPENLVESSKRSIMLLVSKKALGHLDVSEFKTLNIGNVIGLEELHLIYPHIGGEWDGTVEDAAIMLAGLLRYRRVHGMWNARAELLGLEKAPEPARLWWLTQFYRPENRKRRQELHTCLETNSKSKLIEKIVLLNEVSESMPSELGDVPIEEVVIGKRLTYADVIEAIKTFPTDVIVAFANADICIDDESWRQLWQVNMENKFLALLRYDVPDSGIKNAKIFGPRPDSQDTWVVRVSDVVSREMTSDLNFNFGRMGCDNAIALEMLRMKFVVVNPALSMKTWHYHTSNDRTYVSTDIIERDAFHYIHESGFHDLNPVFHFKEEEIMHSFTPATIMRPIRGSDSAKWIVAANKTLSMGDAPFKLGSSNSLLPAKEIHLSLKNCFQNPGGLLFDKDRLIVGSSKVSQKIWSKARISSTTPSLQSKKCLIAPWPIDISRESYVLRFLSKILQLVPGGAKAISAEGWEFFCSDKEGVVDAMEPFEWDTKELPVIGHEEGVVIWCEEARAVTTNDTSFILAEDISALRSSLRGWKNSIQLHSGLPRLVIVEDGEVLNDELVRRIEDVVSHAFDVKVVYPGRTSVFRMTEVLSGAWGVICRNGLEACGWNWIMPHGSYVFELGGVTTRKGGLIGLEISSASGLEHRFCSPVAEKLFEEIWREEEIWKETFADGGGMPVIWMPRSDLEGYFGHAGDSFREMVRLWGKAGYCRVREHPTATMVWWGSVGGALLYDRPNHDWRLAAPLSEKEWKFALFGNPRPTANGKAWFFWPRRPELVEELAEVVVPFSERLEGIVFYGKTENKIQEKRRAGDWSSVCRDWVMAKKDEAHVFTQREYLEKLQHSRFGLCLAGYGLKCHREVECMAMGCVPLCAPEVDMDSYANPPQEGVHYLRVDTPEAAAAASKMSEEDWTRMSEAGKVWWRDNASCSGSFALTKSLVEAGVSGLD